MIELRHKIFSTWSPDIHSLGTPYIKKSYFSLHFDPYMRCLGSDEARKVMQKIHDNDCGNHMKTHFLARKVINQGCYWPKMFEMLGLCEEVPTMSVV